MKIKLRFFISFSFLIFRATKQRKKAVIVKEIEIEDAYYSGFMTELSLLVEDLRRAWPGLDRSDRER